MFARFLVVSLLLSVCQAAPASLKSSALSAPEAAAVSEAMNTTLLRDEQDDPDEQELQDDPDEQKLASLLASGGGSRCAFMGNSHPNMNNFCRKCNTCKRECASSGKWKKCKWRSKCESCGWTLAPTPAPTPAPTMPPTNPDPSTPNQACQAVVWSKTMRSSNVQGHDHYTGSSSARCSDISFPGHVLAQSDECSKSFVEYHRDIYGTNVRKCKRPWSFAAGTNTVRCEPDGSLISCGGSDCRVTFDRVDKPWRGLVACGFFDSR